MKRITIRLLFFDVHMESPKHYHISIWLWPFFEILNGETWCFNSSEHKEAHEKRIMTREGFKVFVHNK